MTERFKVWEGHYRHGWDQDPTKGMKAHTMRLQFDGGVEHKDGSMWKIARLLPGKTFHSIMVYSPGIAGVSIDLGCVGLSKCCPEEAHEDLKFFFDGFSVANPGTGACGPWYCKPECKPQCCPPPADPAACPPDPRLNGNFELSDLVLTLHGTPPACAAIDIVFMYT